VSTVVIRRGDRLDVPFLRSLLGHAYNWHVNVFDTDIAISRYVDGWGRRGDTALIAMDDGHSVGAGWYRLFPESVPGYGFLDGETPELTIVVVPSRQGEGIGERLLDALLARAKSDGYSSVSVSVERGKPEAESYLAHGFEQAGEHRNTLTLRRAL
jgi:GNAT superfamily N-acetyltransferase